MLTFYGADHTGQTAPAVADLGRFISSLAPQEGVLVAVRDDSVVGFAAYCQYPALPMGRHGLFLLDLFVRRAHRRSGIGRALIRGLAQVAVDLGAIHLDWTADQWNDGSLGFYRAVSETDQVDKVYHRLSGDALKRLAARAGRDGEVERS